jgi:HAMP domain-containing protein/signal transduction histidine kinase
MRRGKTTPPNFLLLLAARAGATTPQAVTRARERAFVSALLGSRHPARRAMTAVELPPSEADPRRNRVNGGRRPNDEFLEELCRVLTAAEAGDDRVRLNARRAGVQGEVARRFNALVQRQASLNRELSRVARVVGRDGRMHDRIETASMSGMWANAAGAVNGLIDDLVRPTNEVARVLSAVAEGDLSQKLPVTIEGRPVKGEFQRIGAIVNAMVDQLSSFSAEVTRVAREVGTDGKLGGQARVEGMRGTWQDLTVSVNVMAANLTDQVRNIALVTTAVANGDLSQKITVDARGEVAELKQTVNTMVDQLRSFANEVTRVAREVGTDGRLGGQAEVPGVSGTWKDLTDSVNFMASNLTDQVRNIAQVTTAVARGDLSQKITVEAKGEVAALAETINSMTDTLRAFADEVTRVAREVGTDGRLGGQAEVPGVSGTWKDLTDNVNQLAGNLTDQVRNIAQVATAVARGDLSQKITVEAKGEVAALAETINSMTDTLRAFADEVTRVAREVGTDGRLGGQAEVPGVSGTWKDLTDSVNFMASNLTDQVRNIAQVTTAVARGDLSQKITVDARGEILELKSTINTMVDQLSSFADEVTRVAREVGTDGRLGGQADVKGVSGTWKDLTDNVNQLAGNLTSQVRNIAQVTTAVQRGDLSQKITVEAQGEVAELKDTINTMVDQLSAFADEATRVAREVGTEGRLGGQARVPGVAGTWKDLTDSVNFMASNLTDQVRDIARVTTAVANGDLSQKILVDVRGEMLELKRTVNTMVDQLGAFADEVTRVAREVGTEGRLGGQADVPGVSGTWKHLTDNVNQLAGNLTSQVRNIAQVTTAVAKGDLSQKITVEARGEVAELKDTINTMVDQLSAFADEVTRVAREVGTEGRLGGQADVPGVAGTWKALTDNVNQLAGNLTSQVRNIAQVTTAVQRGDLSQKITVEAQGEVAELKDTINTMVDQLRAFGDEVTRVAREVGTEGRLGGQAEVPGVSGTWKDLTDNVNQLAGNLTSQVRNIAQVTTAVQRGDLSQKITVEARGEVAELKDTINTMVDQLRAFGDEVTRVAREVGTDGKLGGQAIVPGVSGTWKDLTDNVNQLANNLTSQVRNIAQVTTAVAKGDLSQKITVEVRGELLELKNTINTMVDQLSTFAEEVTRVAREVGTEGKLGGQADVRGVSGTWKDLTDSVNSMADNLTDQVRNIAQVTTAVADGDLSQSITVPARGEILQLKNTINKMVDTLSAFADEVTRVAREVGTEGKLGGQAEVEGVSGTWKRLTESVNQLASNLTTQVRSIADVATAVTQGDLTRTITVDAAGEVGDLKDNINRMIVTLRDTTTRNQEEDFLKSNLARIGAMLQGHRDLRTVSRVIMSELTPLVGAQLGAFYMGEPSGDDSVFRLVAGFGYRGRKGVPVLWRTGEGLVGQAALERRTILSEVTAGSARIETGLTAADPVNVIILPVLFEDQVLAVIELASVRPFTEVNRAFLDQIVETVGIVLNTIIATMRTEELLQQSQSLAQELGSQSEELQRQQRELQHTNAEIELARRELEERAEQLALSSKYKSEFLANMSHELRTPLNSLLILARLLAENSDANLTDKQVEFARSIYDAGNDLLALISDILDLSKVEAGKMDIAVAPVRVDALCGDLEQVFRPIAAQQALSFSVEIADDVPEALTTDEHRVQQILKNLLSNAFKFTDHGSVTLRVSRPGDDVRFASAELVDAPHVVAFSVIDSGIGIKPDQLLVIFEAFQQADGTTSRKYGGTGLGLSISREIARLLGGEIQVTSEPGVGSMFTLLLPTAAPFTHTVPSAVDRLPEPLLDRTDAQRAADLKGHHVLVVDDDVRNVYALTSALEEQGMEVVTAESGQRGIELLQATPGIELVVMDIMMPGMDGYEAMRAIRAIGEFAELPIIALTAKAMRGDREESLAAGASDYITKPVDIEQLLDTLRIWLYR